MEEDSQGKTPEQIKFNEKVAFWSLIAIFLIYVVYTIINLFSNLKV